ncbi:Chalcone-flavanone isomerase [Musa troglodytarum]|uniref:Chalcone-flavanone isomerase n=1 Tax=Musa troglodytarum TaxID=320322 RepID=A0A9E7GW97_9LILI|nr:Chalcone-flavanone isomerase [Musa troglodytarum]
MAGVIAFPARPPSRTPHCRPKLHSVLQWRGLHCGSSKFPSTSPAPLLLTHPLGRTRPDPTPRASVGSADYVVEPGTSVKFPKELQVPGCSSSLVLLGTGYREKVFAIIGVKTIFSHPFILT